MPEISDDKELAVCCADFYNHPLVLKLLDGILHPGGLALSALMGERMGLFQSDIVLDIACGDGKTATYFSKTLKCKVTGIDAGSDMVEKAKQLADDLGVGGEADFRYGLAHQLPFDDESFTAAYSECVVCTFTDKKTPAQEVFRVLRAGGILGVSDMTLKNRGDLDDELKGLLGRVACIADALPTEGYIDLFQEAGFELVEISTQSDLLEEMARKAIGRAKFYSEISSQDEEQNTMKDALRIIGLILNQIETRNLGYELLIFKK